MNTSKTFPLRVTEEWLERVEKARPKHESKHEYIIKAVNEKMEKEEAEA